VLNFKKDIWPIIEAEKVSSIVKDSAVKVSSTKFKPLSDVSLKLINAKIENEMKIQTALGSKKGSKELVTYNELKQKAASFGDVLMTNYKTRNDLKVTVDSMMQRRDVTPFMANGFTGSTQFANNNIWISPAEASLIYSGKGIPELIIEKKSHSPLLNGLKIKNPHLTAKEMDKIAEDVIRYQFDMRIAEALRDSLVFGGALFFPKFKKDSPQTTFMSVANLVKYGILGKDSIERFIILDRWNVVFTPDWNPLSAAFLKPESFFIPFLGSVMNSERCSRVVTSPAAGYWGTLMTLGWGVSDIPGWIDSVLNYDAVMQAIPFMIKQMSLLARTFDTSGMSAMEGAALLDMMGDHNTIRNRDTGPESIVNIDTIGDLKAISRDFTRVPELVRLLRQDIGARARYPEELIWSSEKGAFSSGDSSDSAFEKQTENVRYTHLKVAKQLKEVVMIFVMNSLGTSDRVIKALPYTTIEFDNPKLSNAKDRSEIAAKINKGIFDAVAAGIPVPIAINMAQQLSDNEFSLSSELMEQIESRQKDNDLYNNEKRELELKLMQKQIDAPVALPGAGAGKPKTSGGEGEKKGHSYADRLEQKKHEKIGSGRTKNIGARQESKKLS
jgi:hypothetical protein